MEPQQIEQPHTLCPKCNNFILTSNFLIHEARCKGNNMQSSTFRNSQVSALRRRESQRNRNSDRAEIQQERIPCPFCGYGQTLRELDSHPPVCPHREVQCSLCKQKFPLSLMQQHDLVCISRQRSLPSRPQQQPIRPPQQNRDERDNENRVRPQPRMQQPRIPNRRPQDEWDRWRNQQNRPQQPRRQQPIRNQRIEQVEQQQEMSPTMFRIIDQRRARQDPRMNLMRMMMGFPFDRTRNIMDDDPFERGINTQRRIVVLDPGALIALLAGRARPTGHTGMTKQQINKFPVTKYKNHGNAQKQQQEDMCAICYCNFQQGENCMNLPCKHKFHPECIGKWLQKNPTCPLCKKNFKNNNNQQSEGMQQRQMGQNGQRNVFLFDRMNLP